VEQYQCVVNQSGRWVDRQAKHSECYVGVWLLPCSGDRQDFNLDEEAVALRWMLTWISAVGD
jgi:hypothetical protein